MPSIDRAQPSYLQTGHMRDQIISGELTDGDPVLSARHIAATWGVALATATKALSTLRSEGLVRGVAGVGTIVQTKGALHRSARDRSISIDRTGRIYPPEHYAKIRSSELVLTPETVAGAAAAGSGTDYRGDREVRRRSDRAGSGAYLRSARGRLRR